MLESVLNFGVTQVVGITVGVAGGFVAWNVAKWCWDYFKPLKPIVHYLTNQSYQKGKKTKMFLDMRVKDQAFRDQLIREAIDGSEAIQDAFVRGISGL